jgi:hypothetical protein
MTEEELKNLIKVIKAVKKLGVKSLKMGTLEFEIETNPENLRADRPVFKPSKKKVEAANKQNELQLEMDTANESLSTMHVEDPAAFEEAIVQQVISDTDDTSGGDILEEAHYQ